jgi:hypothetical protein
MCWGATLIHNDGDESDEGIAFETYPRTKQHISRFRYYIASYRNYIQLPSLHFPSLHTMSATDSDSDDDILNCTTFLKRPSRAEERKKKAEDDFLDAAIANNREKQAKKARLVSQSLEEDEKAMQDHSEKVRLLSQSNLCNEQQKVLKGLTGLYSDECLPEHALKLQVKAVQERKIRFGERLVIDFDPARATKNQNLCFYESATEAYSQLKHIVDRNMEKEIAALSSQESKEEMTESPLKRFHELVMGDDVFEICYFLDAGRLTELAMKDNDFNGLDEIVSWLFCVAIDAKMGDRLTEASMVGLVDLITHEMVPETCWFLSSAVMLECLNAWLDLESLFKPVDENEEEPTDKVEQSKENEASSASSSKEVNHGGLCNLLDLWAKVVAHDGCDDVEPKLATTIFTVLLRLSLDRAVALNHLESIHIILASLSEHLGRNYSDGYKEWQRSTADAVFNGISSFGKQPEVNYDDLEGYLSRSLVVEQLSAAVGPIHLALVCQALAFCTDTPNWVEYVKTSLLSMDIEKKEKVLERVSEDNGWLYLLSGTSAINFMLTHPEKQIIMKDYPLVQAIVILAVSAFDAALQTWVQPPVFGSTIKEYGRQTDAVLICDVLRWIQDSLEEIKILTKKANHIPNASNTYFWCNSYENYLSHSVEWAAAQGGIKKKEKVQRSIAKYFKSSTP